MDSISCVSSKHDTRKQIDFDAGLMLRRRMACWR